MIDVTSPLDLARQAENRLRSGNPEEALDLFQKALVGYQALSDELAAAETRNNISVLELKMMRPQQAYEAVVNTPRTFEHFGDRRRQAMALGNLAAACEALGKKEEAAQSYQKSSELFKELGDREMRSYVLKSLSALQIRSGNPFEALSTMKIALENKPTLNFKEKFLLWLARIPFRMMNR